MKEVRPVPGFEAHYAVSNDGRVYSLNYRRTGRTQELAQSTHPEGYKRVKAWYIRKDTGTPVHRLVASAFIPNPLGLPQVNHIDGDKGNNCVENLEWVTNARNQQHSFEIGRIPPRGVNHWNDKLTEEEVRDIADRTSQPYRGQQRELAKEYGVSNYTIFDIQHGRSWKHLSREPQP